MNLIERAKNICVTPATEWPVIQKEDTPTSGLITQYVVPLAGVSAVAGFIGGSIVGTSAPFIGTFRVPIVTGLASAVVGVVAAVVGCLIMGAIINALAPTFGGQKNPAQSLKIAVYSFTPAWIAGILQIIPALGVLAILGALYGIYLMYLGLPQLMQAPEDKTVGYTAAVVICGFVVAIVLGAVVGVVAGAGALGAGLIGGGAGGGPAGIEADGALGPLQDVADALEQSAEQAQAAAARGDTVGQAAAASDALAALIGGGAAVDPVGVDEMMALVPESFAGLPRTARSVERPNVGLLTVAQAESEYGDGGAEVDLEIVDTGGMAGIMGLAGWMGVEGERQDASGTERTRREGDRLVHEEQRTDGGTNEFAVVVGQRFLVTARSADFDVDALRAGVNSAVDLDRLEAVAAQGGR